MLRLLLPSWHRKEREIIEIIRNEILEITYKITDDSERKKRLAALENIKGYRDIRYEKFKQYF